MNHSRKTKKKVLRAVFEDNAGIPRSHLGKRQSKVPDEADGAGRRAGYRSKAVLIVLLGLVSLVGMNFRLVTVDVTGPVAMQVADPEFLQYLDDPVFSSADMWGDLVLDSDPSAVLEPVSMIEGGQVTTERYDEMLAQLGIPMADLFSLKVRTIVIDPGHGGIDPGATGSQGVMEKDIALDIALRLREKLSRSGNFRVLLTREQDEKVYLKERVAFAKDNKADLFISIHINSLPAKSAAANYVETYYFGPHTDQRSLDLAEKENYDSNYVMGDFREVIARIGDTLKTEESEELANAIHKRLYRGLKRHNSKLDDAGSKTGPFVVLLGVDVPSVLVEVSCISNRDEETRLSKPEYRDDVAGFLKSGIVEYLEQRGHQRSVAKR